MKTSALRRFLDYVTFDTRSDEQSVYVSEHAGPARAAAPAGRRATGARARRRRDGRVRLRHGHGAGHARTEHAPTIGFIAHVDTSPEMPGDER